MSFNRKNFLNRWVMIAGFLIFIMMGTIIVIIMFAFQPPKKQIELPTAVMSIIFAPTSTSFDIITTIPTPTAEIINGLQKGVYVRVSGTGSDGVKLRTGPGKDYSSHFIGAESEVFIINEGPISSDGYTWWHLEAPYDKTRNGWAVSDYLQPIVTQ